MNTAAYRRGYKPVQGLGRGGREVESFFQIDHVSYPFDWLETLLSRGVCTMPIRKSAKRLKDLLLLDNISVKLHHADIVRKNEFLR